MRLFTLAAACFAATAVVAACSSSSPPTGANGGDGGLSDASRQECSPGEMVSCYCAGGGFGTTVCTVSEAGSSLSACMGCVDSSTPTDAGPTDAGGGAESSTSNPPPVDGGALDGSNQTPDTGAPSPNTALVFAHAAPGVPPVRLCFAPVTASQGGVLPIPPVPDAPSSAPAVGAIGVFPAVAAGTPGIYPGSIASIPFASDLTGVGLQVFAVLSSSIADDVNYDGGVGRGPDGGPEETCDALVGGSGLGTTDPTPGRLVAGTDFVALPTLAAGSFQAASSYLLSLTGCFAGANTGAATCGAGTGTNAQLGVAPLDTATTPSGGLGAQFANRSSALEGTASGGHAAATAGVIPVFVTGSGSAMTVTPIESSDAGVLFSASGIVPSTAATAAVDPSSASFGVVVVPSGGGAPSYAAYPTGDLFAMPLTTIQTLSSWSGSIATGATSFQAGAAFTFLLIGDPSQPAAGSASYDGRGLHFIAFPNRFSPKLD